MRVQVVLLGPVKQPSYYRAQEWSEFETERPRWYKICYNTDYRVGDGFKTTFDEQCAFMAQPNLEVYGAHNFESDGNYTIDNEFYVSLEVAELLKKAGFDWYNCSYRYNSALKLSRNIPGRTYGGDYHCIAPTLDVAQRWLREVKGFEIFVGFTKHDFGNGNEKAYFYDCYEIPENEDAFEHFEDIYYYSYEEAQESGIKKALELILEKGE